MTEAPAVGRRGKGIQWLQCSFPDLKRWEHLTVHSHLGDWLHVCTKFFPESLRVWANVRPFYFQRRKHRKDRERVELKSL